ncbi:rhodanese-like domain-containing protein [Sulfurimonas sp.]|uniref:rhodanese-like domain-containing protein n=1 Tax=Sulfurimonas sp. TaxID=2022749 RepID=UPI0025E5ACF3|nr:rhodanese-like domain-containing protein [Sulfurimonas sp.]
MKKIVILLIASISILLGGSDFKIVTFDEAVKLHKQKDVLFIDARPAKLFKLGTILGSININMKDKGMLTYKAKLGMLPSDKDTKIVSFCNGPKCMLSHKLAKNLKKDGYTNIVVYAGGAPEWKKKKAPSMGLLRECKKTAATYVPEAKNKVVVNGVTLYKGADEGMIDQRWFSKKLNDGEVPKGVVLVDVRKVKDYKEGHYKGAINVPYDSDKATLDFSKLPKNKTIVFYCYTGMMSVGSFQAVQENKMDTESVFYVDANVECENGKCKAEANEDL